MLVRKVEEDRGGRIFFVVKLRSREAVKVEEEGVSLVYVVVVGGGGEATEGGGAVGVTF